MVDPGWEFDPDINTTFQEPTPGPQPEPVPLTSKEEEAP